LGIEHIINVYFDICEEEIFFDNADAPDLYDKAVKSYLSLVSASVIGRKMRFLLRNPML
jgi:hypothetical protein